MSSSSRIALATKKKDFNNRQSGKISLFSVEVVCRHTFPLVNRELSYKYEPLVTLTLESMDWFLSR